MNLIRAFLNAVIPPRDTRERARKATIESLGTHMTPSTVVLSGHEIQYLLPYHAPLIRSVILEAKFYEHAHAHTQLGLLLAEYLLSYQHDAAFENTHYVLIPVPLSKKRRRERGYNQVELVLREALKGLPDTFTMDTRLLRRVRDTRPQTKLGRKARLTNMEGAFVCSTPLGPSVTYILVDDVATTGSTMCAAYLGLISGGTKTVQMVALAH